ncbi:MAG: hypothetical protein M3371_03750 [Acidobacteriota bacterium]|nr:hypothetical protein [Acidobacteriota bacterium]
MKRKKAEQIEELRTAYTDFADYLARIVMHPKTPAALKSALQAVIVNAMSNESGYNWADDEEGLRFLVPRFLEQMNEEYAFGVQHTIQQFISDSLPEALRQEIREGGAH